MDFKLLILLFIGLLAATQAIPVAQRGGGGGGGSGGGRGQGGQGGGKGGKGGHKG